MKTVKLGDVCEFKPKKLQARQLIDGEDLVSFAPMELLPINQKYFTSAEERSLDSVYSSYTYFAENDVIYAKITPCFENGKLSIAKNLKNGVGFGSSEFVPIRCSDKILPEYLYYFLLNPSFIKNGIPKMTGASGHRRVPNEYTENLEIELPSLEEQRRIVARLDAAFEKISAAEVLTRQNIDNVSALQKSILHKYLSVSDNPRAHRLGDYLQKTFNIRWQERINQSFEYIDLTSVDRLSHTITKTTKINASNAPSRAKKIVNTGDVIFGTTRPTLNRLSIVDGEYDNQICSTGFCVLRGNDEIKPGYIYYLLNTSEFNSFIESRQRGTSYPAVTDSDVKDYRVHIPPKSVQIEIVSKLDNALSKTRKLESQYQKRLEKLTDLRQSVLKEAFSTTNTV